jgi:hypothetical protein
MELVLTFNQGYKKIKECWFNFIKKNQHFPNSKLEELDMALNSSFQRLQNGVISCSIWLTYPKIMNLQNHMTTKES